jgi:hypothetical protein
MTLRTDLTALLADAGIVDVDTGETVADEQVRSSTYQRIVSVAAASESRDGDRAIVSAILRDPIEMVSKTAVVDLVDTIAMKATDPDEFRPQAVVVRRQGPARNTATSTSRKALHSIMAKVRTLTNRSRHLTLEALLRQLNPVPRGWCTYFRHGVSKSDPFISTRAGRGHSLSVARANNTGFTASFNPTAAHDLEVVRTAGHRRDATYAAKYVVRMSATAGSSRLAFDASAGVTFAAPRGGLMFTANVSMPGLDSGPDSRVAATLNSRRTSVASLFSLAYPT